jgi:hypothetical protein
MGASRFMGTTWEFEITGLRCRRNQPIQPEEGYAVKANTVRPVSLCSSATTFMARPALPRWFERLPLLFAFLVSLFSTELGTDE